MGWITEAMVRRRSEHNDGCLSTLQELVLQEEGIDKIVMLGQLCPHLRILYMPNNIIPRIENMHRLKELEYLNLALNNIFKVEGLEKCEALHKLDLTLNFVDIDELFSVSSLRANVHLTELYTVALKRIASEILIGTMRKSRLSLADGAVLCPFLAISVRRDQSTQKGNPCTDFPGHRKYIIANLPSLKRLDGHAIKPSERIIAEQESIETRKELLEAINNKSNIDTSMSAREHPHTDGKGQLVREYTAATRLAEHHELQQLREEQQKSSKTKHADPRHPPSKRRTGFDPLPSEGRIYQKNEGGWDFKLTESECGRLVTLEVAVGRYLDTSLIDVDIHPTLARILVKGKLMQLRLPCEVRADESTVKRSGITGHLLLTCPKLVPDKHRADSHPPTVPTLKPSHTACTKPGHTSTQIVDISKIVTHDHTPKIPQSEEVQSESEREELRWGGADGDDDVPPLE